MGVGIPVGHHLAGLHLVAVAHLKDGAVGQLVALPLGAAFVLNDDLAGTGDRHQFAGRVLHRFDVFEVDDAAVLDFDAAHRCGPRRGTANVESAHGELGARLADRLGGDHAHRLADVDAVAAGQVAPVAARTDAVAGFAGDGGTHPHLVNAVGFEHVHQLFVEQHVGPHQLLVGAGTGDRLGGDPTENALAQGLDHIAAFDDRLHEDALLGAAVFLGDHHVLRHVHQAPGEITGVGGLEGGVGQTLARAVGGDEVLEHVQPFAEVGGDGRFDDRTVGLGHQAAHPGQLPDLGRRTPGAGIGHHEDGVEGGLFHLVALAVHHLFGAQARHHRLGHLVVGARPDVDHLVVTLAVGHQTRGVLFLDLLDLPLGGFQQLFFFRRHRHVVCADGHPGPGGEPETGVHQLVGEDHRLLQPQLAVALVDQPRDRLFVERGVDQVERQARRDDLPENGAADGGVAHRGDLGFVARFVALGFGDPHLDPGVERGHPVLIGAPGLGDVGQHHPLALGVDPLAGHVIEPQHHVLGGHDDGLAVGRGEDVVGGHHQRARFELGLQRQGHVDRHLVAVEVGVEGGADQRMELDRLALDEHRLEGLDAQAVQGGRPVEQHRMLSDHAFENVPHLGIAAIDHLFGRLDGGGQAQALQAREDEGLEQLQGHALGQAALVQLEGGAHHDHRTARVVHPLTEQVLAEPPLLALDHVGQGLERTLVGAGDGAPAAAVVEQGVHRLLEHALFVAHDDVGRGQLQQPLEAVVAVDHPAVEIVEIGGGEAPAVERHQGPQIGRQHRQHLEDHPLGPVPRLLQGFEQLEALGDLLDLGFGIGRLDLLAQLADLGGDVEGFEQLIDRLGAHPGVELVAVLFDGFEVLLVVHQLAALEHGHARVDDHIGLEIENPLDVLEGHVEQQADTRGQRLEIPDVRHRRSQLDVAHAFAAHLGEGHLHAALFAHHAAVLEALVLAAQALVVVHRAEDLGAEEAFALGLEGAVVDGFGLFHLAVGPRTDHLRRSQADANGVELFVLALLLENLEQIFHEFISTVSLADGARALTPVPVRR